MVGAGGDDYKNMILSIVKKVMNKDVAMQYSTFGKKGKKCLTSLRVHSAITSTFYVLFFV